MRTRIEVTGSTLRTPHGIVADCWEDRTSGLLSYEAGLALIPYMMADQRTDADYEKVMTSFEYGIPTFPERTESRYQYFVDGEVALPSRQVNRTECEVIFDDGVLTGRLYLTALAETQHMLEGR